MLWFLKLDRRCTHHVIKVTILPLFLAKWGNKQKTHKLEVVRSSPRSLTRITKQCLRCISPEATCARWSKTHFHSWVLRGATGFQRKQPTQIFSPNQRSQDRRSLWWILRFGNPFDHCPPVDGPREPVHWVYTAAKNNLNCSEQQRFAWQSESRSP